MSETLIDNEDLLVFREDPLVDVEDEFGASFFVLLRNFSLNSNLLRAAHMDVLRDRVVPFVQRRPGFAEIYGMTDRSGARKLNYKIAASRLLAVQQAMLGLGARSPQVHHAFAKSIGEDFFEDRFARDSTATVFGDGLKNSQFRVVVLGLTPAPIGIPTKRFRANAPANTLAFCRRHIQQPG